jgi:hypothetical protein
VTNHRITRGRRTQTVVADYLRAHSFPGVTTPAASEGGSDVRGIVRDKRGWVNLDGSRIVTGTADIEIKATDQLALIAGLRQSQRRAPDAAMHVSIYRPRGVGETNVEQFVVLMTLGEAVQLWADAGWTA